MEKYGVIVSAFIEVKDSNGNEVLIVTPLDLVVEQMVTTTDNEPITLFLN